MATYQNGGKRTATANTVTAMRSGATKRQCPKCGRKSALVRIDDVTACRWTEQGKCDYVRLPEWMR